MKLNDVQRRHLTALAGRMSMVVNGPQNDRLNAFDLAVYALVELVLRPEPSVEPRNPHVVPLPVAGTPEGAGISDRACSVCACKPLNPGKVIRCDLENCPGREPVSRIDKALPGVQAPVSFTHGGGRLYIGGHLSDRLVFDFNMTEIRATESSLSRLCEALSAVWPRPETDCTACGPDHDVRDFVSGKMVPCKQCRPAEHELTLKVERLKDSLIRCRNFARDGLRMVPRGNPSAACTDVAEEGRRTLEREV